MTILQSLRQQRVINRIVAHVFLSILNIQRYLFLYVVPRWRVAGAVDVSLFGNKFKMYTNCDDAAVDSLFYQSVDEEAELKVFMEFAKKSKAIFDIGANTGIYSLLAAVVNPKAKIYAFEPYISNMTRLELNLKINAIQNVVPVRQAVGAVDQKMNLTVPSKGQICTVNSFDPEFTRQFHKDELEYIQIEVDCVKIDSFWLANKLKGVSLVKIDVESFEMEVFKGANAFIKANQPVILCEIFVDQERIEFFERLLSEWGYHKYVILKEGIFYLERLENVPSRTFLFSSKKSPTLFIDFCDVLSLFPN